MVLNLHFLSYASLELSIGIQLQTDVTLGQISKLTRLMYFLLLGILAIEIAMSYQYL